MTSDGREQDRRGDGDGSLVGYAAVRYTAYVIIVLALLYFTAR